MRKDALTITLFTCVIGAFGFVSRWIQNMTGFEEGTGFIINDTYWHLTVLGVCIIAVAGIGILSYRMNAGDRKDKISADLRSRTLLFPIIAAVAGFLLIISAVVIFINAAQMEFPTLQRILAFFVLASGLCIPVQALAANRGDAGPLARFSAAVPVLMACFWLIFSYKEHSQDPTVWSFGPEILAISAALLALYYLAGYFFGRRKPRLTIFFAEISAFFCILCFTDNRDTGEQLIFVAVTIIMLLYAFIITNNINGRSRRQAD